MKKYNPEYHHRRSIRLQGYDYSQTGIYFVTICTHQRQCLFGEIRNGKMLLNQIGKIVAQEWLKSAEIRQEIVLDEWIIMPNHLHGIVVIDKKDDNDLKDDNNKGASLAPLQRNELGKRKPKSLSSFIGGFKSSVTKRIKSICDHPNPVIWQRNYHEIIVRDENQLNQIRQYIMNNPQKWDKDPEKPDNLSTEILPDLYF
jgi:REP element-mobilizing transposase RayT